MACLGRCHAPIKSRRDVPDRRRTTQRKPVRPNSRQRESESARRRPEPPFEAGRHAESKQQAASDTRRRRATGPRRVQSKATRSAHSTREVFSIDRVLRGLWPRRQPFELRSAVRQQQQRHAVGRECPSCLNAIAAIPDRRAPSDRGSRARSLWRRAAKLCGEMERPPRHRSGRVEPTTKIRSSCVTWSL
jgi:hypothetical protein